MWKSSNQTHANYRMVEFRKLVCLLSSLFLHHTSQTLILFSSGKATTSFVPLAIRTLFAMGLPDRDSVVTCLRDGYECTTMEFAMLIRGQICEVAATLASTGAGREPWVLNSSLQAEAKWRPVTGAPNSSFPGRSIALVVLADHT